MEQINIPEWMLHLHDPSLTLSPDPADIFASSFTKLNLRDVQVPDILSLGNLPQGIDTTCGLLKVLAASTFSKSTLTTVAVKPYMTLFLDQHRRLWNLLLSTLDYSRDPSHQLSYLVGEFFLSLQDLLLHSMQGEWRGQTRQKICCLWADCIAELIHASQASPSTVMTERTISVLETTTEISSEVPELASAACESTQPAAKALLEEKSLRPNLQATLQVRHLCFEVAT